MSNILNNDLVQNIRNLLITARNQVVQTVNSVMVQTYWNIGKIIVEDEQKGEIRAEYGKKQLEIISQTLTEEFGKGFDTRNLRNMRQFYMIFSNWNAVSTKLSWTHYRTLPTIEELENKRAFISDRVENE